MELRGCATCLVALPFLPRLIHVRGDTPRSKIHVARATSEAKAAGGLKVINHAPPFQRSHTGSPHSGLHSTSSARLLQSSCWSAPTASGWQLRHASRVDGRTAGHQHGDTTRTGNNSANEGTGVIGRAEQSTQGLIKMHQRCGDGRRRQQQVGCVNFDA